MRAILFDFNGVLVDDEPIHRELTVQVLAEEGVDLSPDRFVALCLGRSDRTAFSAVLAETRGNADPALVERLIARKTAYYHARMRDSGFPVFPGARELVVEAAEAGLELGAVTGALRSEVEAALAQMGLTDRFKCLVAAEDVEVGKPDPEGYVLGLRRLNTLPPLPARLLHPHEVLVIEDTPAGLEAAGAAGLATLAVAHTFPAERLQADLVVSRLAEIDLGTLQERF